MAKQEWGVKRLCTSCAARFYDLGRSPAVCPNCGATLDVVAALRARKPVKAAAEEKAKIRDEEDLEDVAVFDDDEEDGVLDIDEDEDDADSPVVPRGEAKKGGVDDDEIDGFQVIDPDADH